ncbi:MAG: hypothetical protein ACKVOE_03540 [Rickettsiales bacterium]
MAVSFGVMVSAVLLSTEMSNYATSKARFTQALDEATLAAAASNAENPLAYGTQYFQANLNLHPSSERFGDPLVGDKMTVTNFVISANADRTEWTGVAEGTIKTSFGKIIGITSIPISSKATVSWDKDSHSEIVAMVDVAGIACTDVKRNSQQDGSVRVDFETDTSCAKLGMMHDALKNIASIGVGYTADNGLVTDPVYKVGIVPFSYKVKIPNTTNLPSFLTAGEKAAGFNGEAYFTNTADAENGVPLPSIVPLTWIRNASDKQALLDKIDSLFTPDKKEFSRPFMVRPALGALASAMLLDPDYHTNFGGEQPVAFHTPKNDKIVVMLTDAANLGCCFTNWPSGNFANHYVYSYKTDNDFLHDSSGNGLCKTMKEQGIEVYTVLFDVSKDDVDAGGEIINAFDACATDDAHKFHIAYGDTATLQRVYTLIGKALMKLKLSK